MRKLLSLVLSMVMVCNQAGFAQGVAELGLAQFIGKPQALALDVFRPVHLRYLAYDSLKDGFEIYLDKGDAFVNANGNVGTRSPRPEDIGRTRGSAPTDSLQSEARKVFEYFRIGLSLPNETFWVNLRPDSPQRIIDDSLAKTDIGRVFLETDVQLKKDLALATSPETAQGKAYWDRLYKKAEELFGSEQVEIPTYTRPWIVPGEVILRETSGGRTTEDGLRTTGPSAYVYKAALKVMLEEDYIKGAFVGAGSQPALQGRAGLEPAPTMGARTDARYKVLNEYSSELIREMIIPQLTKAVNSSKRYAELRQVYNSLILAQWFKKSGVGSSESGVNAINSNKQQQTAINSYLKLIDSRNLDGLTSETAWSKSTYFEAYRKSFAEGEYRIKENVHGVTGPVVRSYVSGGVVFASSAVGALTIPASRPVSFNGVPFRANRQEISPVSSAVKEEKEVKKVLHLIDQETINPHLKQLRESKPYSYLPKEPTFKKLKEAIQGTLDSMSVRLGLLAKEQGNGKNQAAKEKAQAAHEKLALTVEYLTKLLETVASYEKGKEVGLPVLVKGGWAVGSSSVSADSSGQLIRDKLQETITGAVSAFSTNVLLRAIGVGEKEKILTKGATELNKVIGGLTIFIQGPIGDELKDLMGAVGKALNSVGVPNAASTHLHWVILQPGESLHAYPGLGFLWRNDSPVSSAVSVSQEEIKDAVSILVKFAQEGAITVKKDRVTVKAEFMDLDGIKQAVDYWQIAVRNLEQMLFKETIWAFLMYQIDREFEFTIEKGASSERIEEILGKEVPELITSSVEAILNQLELKTNSSDKLNHSAASAVVDDTLAFDSEVDYQLALQMRAYRQFAAFQPGDGKVEQVDLETFPFTWDHFPEDGRLVTKRREMWPVKDQLLKLKPDTLEELGQAVKYVQEQGYKEILTKLKIILVKDARPHFGVLYDQVYLNPELLNTDGALLQEMLLHLVAERQFVMKRLIELGRFEDFSAYRRGFRRFAEYQGAMPAELAKLLNTLAKEANRNNNLVQDALLPARMGKEAYNDSWVATAEADQYLETLLTFQLQGVAFVVKNGDINQVPLSLDRAITDPHVIGEFHGQWNSIPVDKQRVRLDASEMDKLRKAVKYVEDQRGSDIWDGVTIVLVPGCRPNYDLKRMMIYLDPGLLAVDKEAFKAKLLHSVSEARYVIKSLGGEGWTLKVSPGKAQKKELAQQVHEILMLANKPGGGLASGSSPVDFSREEIYSMALGLKKAARGVNLRLKSNPNAKEGDSVLALIRGESVFLDSANSLFKIALGISDKPNIGKDLISLAKEKQFDINIPEGKTAYEIEEILKTAFEGLGVFSSSSSVGVDKMGGIDLRYIEMTRQQASSAIKMPALEELKQVDISKEGAEIKKLIAMGVMPAQPRVSAYVCAFTLCKEQPEDVAEAVECMTEMFSLQAQTGAAASPQEQCLLALLER